MLFEALHYYRNVILPRNSRLVAATREHARRLPVLLLCSLMPVASCLLQGCNRTNHPAQVGERAPNVVIRDGSQTVRLRDYRGKVIVLNFWASWCAPCIEEFPSLIQLQRNMPNDVVVLAVAFDTDQDSYRQFLQDNNLSGITTIDDLTDTSNHAFGTSRPPETYIIDRNGVIRRKFIGMPEGGWTMPEIVNYVKHL
jgi:cytochrome c biogenesis protein CcmG/thiol:disulfide interchange protein DsbE